MNPAAKISPAYQSNAVVAFFDEAELQFETDDQRRELVRALQDMLLLAPGDLQRQRYANYALEPDKWTLNEILTRYYLARPPADFDALLFRDLSTEAAKEKIKQAIEEARRW